MKALTIEELEKRIIETLEPMTEEERYKYLTALGCDILSPLSLKA